MLQLKKSLRLESLRQPFKVALATASRLGADAVEINARTELRPADMTRTAVRHFQKLLADLNLKVSAVHFPTRRGYDNSEDLDRRIDATKQALSMAYELGASVVVNRIGRVATEPDDPRRNTMLQALTDIGNHSQKAGSWLAARTGSEDGETLQALLNDLPINCLGIDFDPADFVINGFSASDAIEILGSHVMNFRARDAVTDLSLGRSVEVELGRGSIDWAKLLGTLEENNYNGYIAIEKDSESNAVEQCGNAIEYLNRLFD